MEPKEELFERFGKQLIKEVRDNQIHFMDMLLEQKAPLATKYKDQLDRLSPAQIEMIKEMVLLSVDGTLHDLLYLLEDANWIHLRLESNDAVLDDIRQAAHGDLQGYIFIWAEKYTTTRLTNYGSTEN